MFFSLRTTLFFIIIFSIGDNNCLIKLLRKMYIQVFFIHAIFNIKNAIKLKRKNVSLIKRFNKRDKVIAC